MPQLPQLTFALYVSKKRFVFFPEVPAIQDFNWLNWLLGSNVNISLLQTDKIFRQINKSSFPLNCYFPKLLFLSQYVTVPFSYNGNIARIKLMFVLGRGEKSFEQKSLV